MKGPWKGVREPDETSPQDDKAGKGTGEESGPDARREDEVTEDEVTEDELMEDELREDDTDSAEDETSVLPGILASAGTGREADGAREERGMFRGARAGQSLGDIEEL
ncbi:MAG: hypothetical protein FRX48_00762 [Lasallia pustulata]|uniref:Uncharacterized protein n=1 Tax=Lasallia pustulata TaxID=136370 RepID=A0A5M8Q4C2_9LECA|nr:MAG: hypothetical protein FRX48_00762 [Lasallia pustulata]